MSRRVVVNPGWEYVKRHTFSPGVRIGNLLCISGLVSVDQEGRVVGKGDIVAQTRQIFENMKAILSAAGASFDDVIRTTEYVTTWDNYKSTSAVRREYFHEPFPAATGVLVSGLTGKDFVIEIEALVVLPETRGH